MTLEKKYVIIGTASNPSLPLAVEEETDRTRIRVHRFYSARSRNEAIEKAHTRYAGLIIDKCHLIRQ